MLPACCYHPINMDADAETLAAAGVLRTHRSAKGSGWPAQQRKLWQHGHRCTAGCRQASMAAAIRLQVAVGLPRCWARMQMES